MAQLSAVYRLQIAAFKSPSNQDVHQKLSSTNTVRTGICRTFLQTLFGDQAMIMTQTPLKETMEDFWILVVQKAPRVILYLNDCQVSFGC